MSLTCACCTEPPEHVITDAQGRSWRFEMHRMFGPLLLRADGQPKERQPGTRSAFWAAFDAWRDERRAACQK